MKKIIFKIKKKEGFVILFAVTITSILLAIGLGVANIALKELKFSTSARATNEAFFAADTGVECALFNDKSNSNVFVDKGDSQIQCTGKKLEVFGDFPAWDFIVSGLGDAGLGCAKVSVSKNDTSGGVGNPTIVTTIISKGYDIGGDSGDCSSTNPNQVEREIKTSY